ncbi:MAG: methyltransferase [Gammaproteobacteria bacterium]|nr:methyltransferase [Gammaproteobacteria bacterium]MCY4357824.1 methyltransferase [Gammaproteobacteria bacterium]
MIRYITPLAGLFASLLGSQLIAADAADTRAMIEMNLSGDIRTEAEMARDANRKPAEVLEFFGLEDNMKVLEISPATGYWSKFVGPTLCGAGGELVFSVGVSEDFRNEVMALEGLECTTAINDSITLGSIPGFEFETGDFDMVLTFWNLHNPSAEDRANLNAAVFASLKSGGIYGVVDHTRRHMQPGSREVGRRLDPVLVIKEMVDTGFEFVDFSEMHYHMEDDLMQEVGTPGVRGNTDRFTLKFRKP